MGHQRRLPARPQPLPSHAQPRTSAVLRRATANPTIEDHPVPPPPSEEAGWSIVIRRPRRRGAAVAGFADSSRMGRIGREGVARKAPGNKRTRTGHRPNPERNPSMAAQNRLQFLSLPLGIQAPLPRKTLPNPSKPPSDTRGNQRRRDGLR